MNIKQFHIPGLAQYSYMVSSAGEAVVIDPMRDFDRYTAYAHQQGLVIKAVTETHIHADFASGATGLAEATGAELALSGYDQPPYRYSMEHRLLRDGDALRAGSLRLEALHTPGHTPEHLSFVLYDEQRNAFQPVAIFSGDFLFAGSLGRPDLLGDEVKHELARELYHSLHRRIAPIPDGVQLYPGHGAGSLCGSGISERATSTLGYERLTQPLFQLEEQAFVQEILVSVPPTPSYYPRMKELNAKGPAAMPSAPAARTLSSRELADLAVRGSTTVLDLRRPEAFGGAHIAGAVNIGAGQNLSLWAGWILSPEQRLVLVDDSRDNEEGRRSLIRVGLDRIEGFLHSGMPGWIDAGRDFESTRQLSAGEVAAHLHELQVVDVRSDKEWTDGHIEGAIHIPLGTLKDRSRDLSKETELVAVCGSGYRSSIAASLLQAQGFSRIASMSGGMTAWHARELATTPA